jgi:transcriptional regulator with XRE-family HTH domain
MPKEKEKKTAKVEAAPEPAVKKRGRKPNSEKAIQPAPEAIPAVAAPVKTPAPVAAEPEKPKRGRKKKTELSITPVQLGKNEDELPDEYLSDICKLIGRNIRQNRKLRKFSIDNLADYLELSASYVGLLERGERSPSLKTLLKICELFGLEFSELFTNKDSTALHEPRRTPTDSKHKSINSLIHRLSETELDFTISVLKGVKLLQKKSSENNYEM